MARTQDKEAVNSGIERVDQRLEIYQHTLVSFGIN
jgi:hypothetical protein